MRLFLPAPLYRKRFARARDDLPLQEVKKTFLLVGVLYNEFAKRIGEASALAITQAFLYQLGCAVQRVAYFPPPGEQRTWGQFHRVHEAQMEEGFISTNQNDVVFHTDETVTFHITRCRVHECFLDMGNASITEAFCRSDETVFTEYLPLMRFHRGRQVPDTIVGGASRCIFNYERLPTHRPIVSDSLLISTTPLRFMARSLPAHLDVRFSISFDKDQYFVTAPG